MNSKWADTGILRKKQTKENFDELLVFGYACKLFRDDERALYIDQGKHLIPWMGDDRLKIDRYDGRGAISDLSMCEASREGYDATRWLDLGEAERKIEQLCDEERYYSLYNNEDEENIYKEEESKRQGSNEFQYNYDVPAYSDNQIAQESVATCEEEDKPFIPPKELDVPVDIEIPKTVKENARIEKTALFISQQGLQMEILIKAKQSDNPQFSFMNQNDPLQKYYRLLVNAFKTGQYKSVKEEPDENKEDNSNTSVNEHYLHPTLAMAGSVPVPQPVMPMPMPQPSIIQYKPNADCAYTQLVSRIKGNVILEKPQQVQDPNIYSRNGQDASEQYYQYYQAQYYQYYRQIAEQYATQDNCDINIVMQNPQLQEQIQQQAVQYAQASCAQFTSPQPPTPAMPPEEEKPKPIPVTTVTSNTTPSKPEQKFILVHYSSDSEDDDEDEGDAKCIFIVPPSDIALIVDKMATYVSKNGPDFEKSVKDKGDARFDFLHESNKYHKYYQHKVKEFSNSGKGGNNNKESQVIISAPMEKKMDKGIETKTKSDATPKERKVIAPVSFSIKKPKEDTPKEIKSALPVEESDDEIVPHVERQMSEPPTMAAPSPVLPMGTATIIEPSTDVVIVAPVEELDNNGKPFNDDPIFEMIDLTDEPPHDKEKAESKKLAEERIKDKLASAVRERTLQMERKKRAALFLKMQSEGGVIGNNKDVERSADESTRLPKSEEMTTHSESELEEGEIRHRSSKPKERKESYHKKSSHKRSTKSRSSYSDSKSRHRKHKKRKQSSSHSSSTSSDNE